MPMLLILTLSTMLLMDVVRSEAAEHERDPSKEALQLLFNKYGGRKIGGMTFEGFEHMMESLGLGDIVIMDHDVHDHHSDDGHFHSLHDNHIHDDLPQQSDDHEVHDDVDSDHLATISHDESGRQKRSADASTVQQSAVNTSDISQVCTENTETLSDFWYKDIIHRATRATTISPTNLEALHHGAATVL